MKALLSARHSVLRLALAILVTAGVAAAAFLSTASVAAVGHTGQALALRSALTQGSLPPALMAPPAAASKRFVYPRDYYQPRSVAGARAHGLKAHATGGPVLIDEGVQTFDVFAPPPAFQPGDGPLTPANLYPIWTPDGRYIIFSSNRSADGHFHLWSISASGDTPDGSVSLHQITTGNGDEYFPAIDRTSTQLAFVSDDPITGNPNGLQNLYTVSNFDASTPTAVDVDDAANPSIPNSAPSNLNVLTIRDVGSPNDLNTGFGEVDRPTWSPDGSRLAFSAIDSGGANAGVHHLWFLFVNSGGATSDLNGPSPTNAPGKLTDGPADDTDPAWAPDASNLIAFATTDTGGFTAGSPGIAPVSAGTGTTRSIYVVTANSTDDTAPTQITTAGQDDFGPAWNLSNAFVGYLTFARGTSPAANHGIYFLPKVYQSGSTVYAPESGTNPALQIDTDDQPARGNPNNPGNSYNKVYPTWSPFLSIEAVVYSSDRSITYNDPTTGAPVEEAISLAQGTNGVGPSYTGLLISRYDDVDPPTFLPYSSSENVHVTDGTDDVPRRNGDIRPGQPVAFTVRLSDREAGVDDNNVYIQIKDPDSKFQDSKGLEHKVFTRDASDSANAPDSFPNPSYDLYYFDNQGNLLTQNVGSSTFFLYNGGFASAPVSLQLSGAGFLFVGTRDNSPLFDQLNGDPDPTVNAYAQLFAPYANIGEAEQVFTFNNNPYYVHERGAVAGLDGTTAISVGIDGGGPSPITTTMGTPAVTAPLGDGDPGAFQSFGQEYECQFVDASYNINGAVDTDLNGANDYGTPYYLAGVDDQFAHSGASHRPPTDAGGNLTWLHLTRSATQDGLGGVLYTATWTTPTSPSDYYLDVIAYDKAVLPDTPTTTAANWRIYDNIWGFSTQAFQGGSDILVVSDNTLGQKFVGSTFAGVGNEDIPPIFYGSESYYTDIDPNLLPNAIYRYVSVSGDKPAFTSSGGTTVPLLDTLPYPEVIDLSGTIEGGVLNGLGVDSYSDALTDSQTSVVGAVGGVTVPISQQYSLWRILARGAVDPQVLNAYSPTSQSQPAINDPLTGITKAATTVPVNHRCVIWTSPYTGDLPLNTVGSLADGAAQNELRAFVLGGTSGNVTFPGGGRLFVSGANVAATLAQGGNTTGSFITDVLGASYVPLDQNGAPTGGNQNLTGNAQLVRDPISGDSFFNANVGPGITQDFFTQAIANDEFVYAAPNAQPLILGNNYIQFPPNGLPNFWRTDGSLDQLGPLPTFFGLDPNSATTTTTAESQIGLITASGGLVDGGFNPVGPGFQDVTSGGRPLPATTGPGLVFTGNTVFASFGLEGIGIEYYKETFNNQEFFYARNQRPNILHNVVDYLRTGTFTGHVTEGSNGGENAANATVYLISDPAPAVAPFPAPPILMYSATTDNGGNYQIQGVTPGAYFLVGYKNGFNRAETPLAKLVEGDTTQTFNINLAPVSPGTVTGVVKDSSGNGIGGALLTFTSTDGLTVVTGTTRADGTYTITGVPPTTYDSFVSVKAGFVSSTTPDAPTPNPFTVMSSQTTAGVNFTLAAIPGTIGGLVVDGFNNSPVGGARIAVTTQAGKPVNDANGIPIVLKSAATATNTPAGGVTGDGQPANYTSSLPQGTFTLTLTPPANYINPTPVAQSVTVTTGAFTRVPPFTLTSTLGTLTGTITDAGTGAPINGATVTVMQTNAPAGTTNTQTFTTAANGTYGPTTLTAGSYTLTVAATNYLTSPATPFTITAHVPTTKNVSLTSTLGTFGGLVTNSLTGQPLAGATVTIADSTGAAVGGSPLKTGATTTTSPADASGKTYPINFGPVSLPAETATGVPLSYTVTVTDQGSGTTTQPDFVPSQTYTVTLTQGKFTVQNVALVPAHGTLGGLVSDSLTPTVPLAGATITVADSTGTVVATLSSQATTTSPAAPTGNGTPQNYSASLYGGTGTTYTVTVSAANHTSQTAKVTVTGSAFTPASFSLVSTLGTVGGLVLDASSGAPVGGVTVTITNTTTKAVVTTLSTTTTETAAPSGGTGQVNYSGTLTAGVSYSATVTKRGYGTPNGQSFTVSPNTFTRIDFSGATYGLPPIHVFPAGYNFFSVPYDYGSIGVGFDQLLGTLNTGTVASPSAGSNRSHIFVWNPSLLQYVLDPTAPADGLHLGQGYWVYLLGVTEVTVPGTVSTAPTVAVNLQRGWNQIGVPSVSAINVSDLTFNNPATGGTISFANASSKTYNLVSSPLYGYNGSTYYTVTAGGTLQPWQSYWIYAFAATTVNIPTSPG